MKPTKFHQTSLQWQKLPAPLKKDVSPPSNSASSSLLQAPQGAANGSGKVARPVLSSSSSSSSSSLSPLPLNRPPAVVPESEDDELDLSEDDDDAPTGLRVEPRSLPAPRPQLAAPPKSSQTGPDSDVTDSSDSELSDEVVEVSAKGGAAGGAQTPDTTLASSAGTSTGPSVKGKKRPLHNGAAADEKDKANADANAPKSKKAKGADGAARNNNPDPPYCHAHRGQCQGAMARCSFIREGNSPWGARRPCKLHFCESALLNHYKVDIKDIIAAGRDAEKYDAADHMKFAEYTYWWQCPRCAGTCQCSICRKKQGLAPITYPEGPKKASSEAKAKPAEAKAKPAEAKSKSTEAQPKPSEPKPKPSEPQAKASEAKPKKKSAADKSTTEKPAKKKVSSTSSAKGKEKEKAQDGALKKLLNNANKKKTTSPSKGAPAKGAASKPTKAGPKKPTAKKGTPSKRQTKLPVKLVEPKKVDAPELDVIKSRLPDENLAARVWLYESLIRFDEVETPTNILKTLDKFDSWTPRQVQTILERMICTIAGLGKNIATGNPRQGMLPLVKAFREFGTDIHRGEPWEQARRILKAHGIEVHALPEVIHEFAIEEIEEPIPPSPTLFTRMTRAKRAAFENREVVRKNLREASVSDFEDDIVPSAGAGGRSSRTRGAQNGKKAFRLDDDEEDDDAGYGDDDMDVGDKDDEDAVQPRRSNRSRRIQEDDSEASDEHNESKSELSALTGEDEDKSTNGGSARASKEAKEKTPEPTGPVPAPHFEEKISILSSLVELVLLDPAVGKDLRTSADEIIALEKDAKNAVQTLEKEHKERLDELHKSAPSFAQKEPFQEWKAKKDKEEKNHKWALLENRVGLFTSIQRLKTRTGPLGVDVDGREYWQLAEYNEQMPRNTTGRWAWGLLVFGKPFPSKGAMEAAAEEQKRKQEEEEAAAKQKAAEEAAAKAGTQVTQSGQAAPSNLQQNGHAAEGQVNGSQLAGLSAAVPAPAQFTAPLTEQVPSGTTQPGEQRPVLSVPPARKNVVAESDTESELSELSESDDSMKREVLPPKPSPEEQFVLDQKPCWQTVNWPYWINKTILYIKYRLSKVEYDENKAALEGPGPYTPKSVMEEEQKQRRVRVEALCKNLETVMEYYMWHFEIVDVQDVVGETASPVKPVTDA